MTVTDCPHARVIGLIVAGSAPDCYECGRRLTTGDISTLHVGEVITPGTHAVHTVATCGACEDLVVDVGPPEKMIEEEPPVTTVHTVTVPHTRASASWRAACTCGWSGDDRSTIYVAISDGHEHVRGGC